MYIRLRVKNLQETLQIKQVAGAGWESAFTIMYRVSNNF